jgi:hypothetical protein
MADLTNAKIANTYKDLLQVNAETSNAGLDGTVRTIQDGGGTASPIAMSTAQLNVTGQFALGGTVLTATADELNDLVDVGRLDTLTAGDDTVKLTVAGVSVSTATVSATVVVNPVLSLTEVDAATGSFNTQVSATNFIAGTGSFTTKVSGVAAEFSGNVSAANVYASTNIFVGGTAVPSAAAITSINAAHTSTNNALVAASAALATSIGTANTRITSVSDFAVALSATMAASIGTRLPLAGGTLTGSVIISNDQPQFEWEETDGTADDKLWRMTAAGEVFYFQTRLDNGGVDNTIFTANRAGEMTVSQNATLSGTLNVAGETDFSQRVIIDHNDKGWTRNGNADDLAIMNEGSVGINILGDAATGQGRLLFGNESDSSRGGLLYTMSTDVLTISTADADAITIGATQNVTFAGAITAANLVGPVTLTTSASGQTANAALDDLVIDTNAATGGMTILGSATSRLYYGFGDTGDSYVASINYNNSTNQMEVFSNNLTAATIDSSADWDFQANALTTTGVITGATLEATGDTSAGDNSAMGYTAAEGLILTGQGSTNDVTIKNDADATVLSIPTGTKGIVVNSGDSGSAGHASADELVVEASDHGGISILTPNNKYGTIFFGDPEDTDVGKIQYSHSANQLEVVTNATAALTIDSSQDAIFASDISVPGTITRAAGADLALDLIVSGAGNPYIRIQGQGVDWITQVRNTANGDTYKIRDNTNGVDALVLTPVTGAATFAGAITAGDVLDVYYSTTGGSEGSFAQITNSGNATNDIASLLLGVTNGTASSSAWHKAGMFFKATGTGNIGQLVLAASAVTSSTAVAITDAVLTMEGSDKSATFAGDVAVTGVTTLGDTSSVPLVLDRNVNSIGAGLTLAFNMRDSTSAVTGYSQIQSEIDDNTNGSEDSTFRVKNLVAGVTTTVLEMVGGAVNIPAGNLDISAGNGITFDSGSNHLDDYEEGTVVATITPGTSGTITLNTSYDELQYTKVGNVCHIQGQLITTSVSSPVGSYIQINLPFTAVSGTGKRSSITITSFGLGGGSTYTVQPNQIIEAGAVLYIYLDASTVEASDQFYIGGSYITA